MAHARTSLPRLFSELAESQHALADALALPDHELLATETLVLALLEIGPSHTPSEVARLTGLSRGRITHLTDALLGRGFISKDPDHIDGRRTILSITADGRTAAIEARTLVEKLERKLAGELGPAGVDMLAQQLSSIRHLRS